MSLVRWSDPSFFPTFGSFFNNLFDDNQGATLPARASIPPVNVVNNEENFVLELAVPGKSKEDFKINIENNVLSISSESEEENESENQNYSRREYSYNSFSRSFTLPDNVTEEKIDATYEDGLLKVILPKDETTISKPKEITVS